MRIEGRPAWKGIAVYLGLIAFGYVLFSAVWGGVAGLLVAGRLANDSTLQAEVGGVLRERETPDLFSPEKREALAARIKPYFRRISWWPVHLLANAITFAMLGMIVGFFGLMRYAVIIPLGLLPLTLRVLAADEVAVGSPTWTVTLGLSVQVITVYLAAAAARGVRRRVSTKTLLIGGAIAGVLALALVAAAVTYWLLHPMLSVSLGSLFTPPAELSTPGVLVGHRVAQKTPLLREARLGWITAIRLRPADRPGLIVAGTGGAGFVGPDGVLQRFVPFTGCVERADVLLADDDARLTFMNRGAWVCPASLLAHDGTTLWTYGGAPGVDDMAAGDLDGTGGHDFVVGFNGDGGVHRVDRDGHRRWRQADGNVWHVEIVDTDGDGRPEIVHTNARGEMVIRDATGQVIRRVRPPGYVAHFSTIAWPHRGDRLHALHAAKDTLRVLDFAGHVVATLPAPRLTDSQDPYAAFVKHRADQPEHLAVVAAYRPWGRSLLYVYAANGVLRYQEILAEACGSLAAVPTGSATETLLVGCQGTVWQYRLG